MTDAAQAPPPADAPRSLVARLRRVLSERSRRGRIASYALAGVAAAGAVALVIWLFPGRDAVTLEIAGNEAAEVAMEPPLVFWPGSGVVVTGRGLTDGGLATLAVDGRRLRSTRADADGGFRESVSLPRDVTPGLHRIEVRDTGSGRVARSIEIEVRDPARPALDVQPRSVRAGSRVVVRGGGLRGGGRVRAVLVAPDGSQVGLGAQVRVRRNGLVGIVARVPAAAAGGSYAVRVQDRGGADVAPPASVDVVAAAGADATT